MAEGAAANSGTAHSPIPGCSMYTDRRRYAILSVLGQGQYGVVVKAKDLLKGGQLVAVKYMALASLQQRYLRQLAVVDFKRCFLTEEHLAIVMECATQGNLFDLVVKKKLLGETEARWFFKQLIMAVDYCHKKGVANRDIKLENTLVTANPNSKAAGPLIKLCDFGFSINQGDGMAQTLSIGTPGYAAPEVRSSTYRAPELRDQGRLLQQGYDARKADVFSAGVLLYTMLVGQYPFGDHDDKEDVERRTKERIARGAFCCPASLTHDARDLLKKLLQPDPNQRIGMQGIEEHPWVRWDSPKLDLSFNAHYLNEDKNPEFFAQRHQRIEQALQMLDSALATAVAAEGVQAADVGSGAAQHSWAGGCDREEEL